MLESYLRRGGRALFLFDGLDEVFDPAQREEVAAQIATFANEYPGVLTRGHLTGGGLLCGRPSPTPGSTTSR